MVMPLDYARPRRYGRPFGEVSPIIDAGNPWDAITQIADFAARHQGFRIGVPDTSFFPFSAICRLRMTFPSGTYSGTGFYIGPGLVLTCGHNLFAKTGDGSGTEAATALTVRPGQQNATTWLDSFDVAPAEWAVHPTWVASGASNRGFDLSVIRVTHAPPGGNYFATINYSPAPETPIAVCGYGGEDVDSDRQHLDIDRVRAVSDDLETFDYNLQTRKGNSGSPVFAHFTDTASEPPQAIPVMGVHVAGHGATLNRGVLLTPDKIDWALGGGISSVSAFSLGAPAPRRTSLGGLPLQRGARGTLGGLPLLPGAGKPMPRTQSYVRPFERAWIVIDQAATGGMSVAWRTFGHPTLDASGKTTLSVRAPNVPAGGKVLWNIPDAAHKARASLESGGAPTDFVTGTSATLRSTAGGPVALDVMVKDSSGATVESNKYWLSSPQFVIVSINATADAFFDGIGLGSRRAAIYAEMAATMRHLYRNVNVRFVFPGEVLPAHLGVGPNAAFPGGVQALPAVIYAEAIGADTVPDPEATAANGAATPYPATQHGELHSPGTLPAPIDQSRFVERGNRVGTFSRGRGWTVGARSRALSEETTVHLPGATVLEGWQAEAFVFAVETALRSTLAANPLAALLSGLIDIDLILDACDRFGVTLAFGPSVTWGLGAGAGGGVAIVFAPGHRIGFAGTGAGVVGHIYSLGASAQVTLISGGPERLAGDCLMAGVSVGTLGWFDAGALDAPIGAHLILDMNRNPFGVAFEFGVATGLPFISLIEAYGQRTKTVTTMARRTGRTLSAPPGALDGAVGEAVAHGARPEEARSFLEMLLR